MHSQLIEGGEVFVTDVAPVVHLCLMGLGVLEEAVEVCERQAARTHDTLVHLCGQRS